MELIISPRGLIRAIYSEAIDLHRLGLPEIRRASYVEPGSLGQWQADLSPVGGPVLGPYMYRSFALQAEARWLTDNWLKPVA
jgi:hypothetical protein